MALKGLLKMPKQKAKKKITTHHQLLKVIDDVIDNNDGGIISLAKHLNRTHTTTSTLLMEQCIYRRLLQRGCEITEYDDHDYGF